MSPIKGLTDRVQAAFPRIGRLRKGGPATRTAEGKMIRMGEDLDHWRFTSDQPDVVAAFEDAYGNAPVLVSAYLPYADVDRNFQCWKERWAAGGLVHRCDGETMTLWLASDGTYQHTPKACDGGCDEVGRLSLIIPELVRAGFVGYITLESHGLNDLLSIQASLLAAAESRLGNPLGLRGIQWSVSRRKEKVSTPLGNGKRGRRDKWLVKLEPAADWVQLQLQAAHNATMMLPAPTGEATPFDRVDDRSVDRDTGEIISTTARELPDEPNGENTQPEVVIEQAPATVAPPPSQAPQAAPEVKANGTPKQPKGWTKAELQPRLRSLWETAKWLGIENAKLPIISYETDSPEEMLEHGKVLMAVVRKAFETKWSDRWGDAINLNLDTTKLPIMNPLTDKIEDMKAALVMLTDIVDKTRAYEAEKANIELSPVSPSERLEFDAEEERQEALFG